MYDSVTNSRYTYQSPSPLTPSYSLALVIPLLGVYRYRCSSMSNTVHVCLLALASDTDECALGSLACREDRVCVNTYGSYECLEITVAAHSYRDDGVVASGADSAQPEPRDVIGQRMAGECCVRCL